MTHRLTTDSSPDPSLTGKNAPTEAQKAAQEPFLSVLRELVRTYQAFSSFDDEHIRKLGLTLPQYDVITTLGNTPGMMMGQLAEKTLVTKGTLTGIVDRLEQKGLVRREVPPENRRCFKIVLTPAGEALFETVFPAHVHRLKERFDQLSAAEIAQIQTALKHLREIL